jgi:DNA-binding MarR family transcriptional regulator
VTEPPSAPIAGADELGTELVRLLRLVDRAQAQYQAENPDAVERSAYLLLVHLVKDGPQRAGALAEAVHSDPSTVSRQIAQLVRLGYVARTADPSDGRVTVLSATEVGRRVFEENRKVRNERIAVILADWEPGERETLTRLLSRFTSVLEDRWNKGGW